MFALMHEHNAITLCLAMILLRYHFLLVLLEITLSLERLIPKTDAYCKTFLVFLLRITLSQAPNPQ